MKKLSILLILIISVFAISSKTSGASLLDQIQGKILLQVESAGEAWYLSPIDSKRYYLGRPGDAFAVMRSLGLGISNANLAKIPVGFDRNSGQFIGLSPAQAVDSDNDRLPDIYEEMLGTNPALADTDGDGYLDGIELRNDYNPLGFGRLEFDGALARRLAGQILLQVESKGQAWYINPDDRRRYYLGRPDQAYAIMRTLGLGISNNDLSRVAISENSLELPTQVVIDKTPVLPEPEQIVECSDDKCFNNKFAVCEKATYVASVDLKPLFPEEIIYYSEILGYQGSDCVLKHRFIQNPNSNWEDKEMICHYDESIKASIFGGNVAISTDCSDLSSGEQACAVTYFNSKTGEEIAVLSEGNLPVDCQGELFDLMTGGL